MKFTQSCNLKRHQRFKHTFEKPFQCNVCNKNYVENCKLKRHQREKHQLQNYFKCFLCNKQFVAKYARKLHLKTHTGWKLNQCGNI